GDVVVALERGRKQARRREAVQDHGARETGEQRRSVRVGVAVVDHDRLAELCRELELRGEEVSLRFARGPVTVEVEAGLADRDCALLPKKLGELVRPSRLGTAGLVGADAERGENAPPPLGARERPAATAQPGA